MSKSFLLTTITMAVSLFVLFGVFMTIVLVNGNAPFEVDTAVADWAYGVRGEKGGFVFWFFTIITEFGHYYFIAAFLIIMAIVWKFGAKFWFLAGTMGVAFAVQEIIKLIVNRPRPEVLLQWSSESSSSFPSGHTNMAVCMFLLVIFFIALSPYIKTWVKAILYVLCGCAIALVPISRIILGMHYFTDIVGGFFLGALFAVLGIIGYKLYLEIKEKKQKKKMYDPNKPVWESSKDDLK